MCGNKTKSRRQFLRTTGVASLVGVAGCLEEAERAESDGTATASVGDANMAPLPENEQQCLSIDGIERTPDNVIPKESAEYQYAPEFQGRDGGHASKNVEMCANCRFYCPPNPPNKVGACTEIEGSVSSQHWCGLWQPTERLDDADQWEGRD